MPTHRPPFKKQHQIYRKCKITVRRLRDSPNNWYTQSFSFAIEPLPGWHPTWCSVEASIEFKTPEAAFERAKSWI